MGHMDRTGLFQLTDLTAAALVQIGHGDPLANDAQIVQIGFDTVVGTAADSDLKLMGKFDIVISLIEQFVDLFRQGKGVDQTILTGCALAGYDGAHLWAGSAGFKTVLGQKFLHRLNVGMGNALNFDG